jgi:hypothetical protein
MSTKTEVALGTSPLFDVEYFREALALFQNVPAAVYCARKALQCHSRGRRLMCHSRSTQTRLRFSMRR